MDPRHRQVSTSPFVVYSPSRRVFDTSHPAVATPSIALTITAVDPPSCHLRHRFNQSTPDRLPSSSRATITGLLTIYVIRHHRLRFTATVDHSLRTLYCHQNESTDLLDMYSDGARTLRITYFGVTRSSKGREFKGHVLLGGIFE